MPPPIFTDDYIRKVCPENHPIPLGKIQVMKKGSAPTYLKKGNTGIKYVPSPIQPPRRVDYLARALSSSGQGHEREKAVAFHVNEIGRMVEPRGNGDDDDPGRPNLRGPTTDDGMSDNYGMNMLTSLFGLGATYTAYQYMMNRNSLPVIQPQQEYDEENPFQVAPDTPPQPWPMLDPRPPPGYHSPQSTISSLPSSMYGSPSDRGSPPAYNYDFDDDFSPGSSGGGSVRRRSVGSESTRSFPSPPSFDSTRSLVSTPDQERTPEIIRQLSESERKRQIDRLRRTKTEHRNLQIDMKIK